MTLKTYQAVTMTDALTQVKRDLGRDAVIVRTRSFRKGGLLGLIGGRCMWEVTAGANAGALAARESYVAAEALEGMGAGKTPRRVRSDANVRPALGHEVGQIREMVASLLAMHSCGEPSDLPAPLEGLRGRLLAQEVSPSVADELLAGLQRDLTGEQLDDEQLTRAKLAEAMEARFRTAGPQDPSESRGGARVLSLIGPTGVGKTTTIAKLAANFKLREGKRVGLITIDTYRIAAVDQLKTYAQLIDVPLEVVLSPDELQRAVCEMDDLDVILIDTAGRSQKDQLRLSRLSAFLSAVECDEVHLVLAATANRSCALSTLEKFAPLGVNHILMTKLDEAVVYGGLLDVASAAQVPISYVTAGQNVPDDIAAAEPRRLATSILEGQYSVAG